MPQSWTEAELAYFAGIIDGEGCLSMSCGLRRRDSDPESVALTASAQLYIGNTNYELIHWIANRFPGSVKIRAAQKSTHKPLWRWLCSGVNLGVLLTAVLPYLVIKREQAKLILELRSTLGRSGTNQTERVSDDVKARRAQIKVRMLELNKRGIA